jgi:WD40 repeat protein
MNRRLALLLCALSAFAASPVPVTALAFSPDGNLLISGGYRELLLWDPGSGRLLRKITGLSGQVRAIAFRPYSDQVLVAHGVPGRSGAASLVDLSTGAIAPIEYAKDEILAAAVSPDGHFLATAGTDAIIRIYPGSSTPEPIQLRAHTGWITGMAFSPDGKLFASASASADKTLRVWKTGTWKEIFQLPAQPTEPVNAVAFAPEGDLLAFASGGPEEHAIRTWRTQSAFTEIDPSRPGQRNALLQTRPLDTGTCLPLAVTFVKAQPHSRLVVGCTDHSVRLIGSAGNSIATAAGHTGWVYAVAASPDGARIASGSGDGTVKIWGASGKLLLTLGEGVTQP